MLNLVIFGPPGAGKGTQSEKLIKKYNLVHISTGDLFRAHISNQTDLGKKVNEIIASGNLVPDEITIAMLREEVQKHPNGSGFIFDGFPRTVAQAEALDSFMNEIGEQISIVVALDVTEEELTQRIALRQKKTGRADDAADKLKKRIEEYFSKTIHVLPYYEKQDKLSKINGIGDIDVIFSDLVKVIDPLVK
ncbi:MAG TPA: adenylate kinase [Sphingobacterium sp.]|nr:adenylate kinase [Sphingobacterium sp.]